MSSLCRRQGSPIQEEQQQLVPRFVERGKRDVGASCQRRGSKWVSRRASCSDHRRRPVSGSGCFSTKVVPIVGRGRPSVGHRLGSCQR